MRVHEDTKASSECWLRFHFLFSLIKESKNSKLVDFDWDIKSTPCQRLYLSKDTTKLMEVINNFVATVYYRVDAADENFEQDEELCDGLKPIQGDDCGQQVHWKVDYHIKRFPKHLA